MVGWHHQLNRHESEQTLGDSDGQGSLVFMGSQTAGHDLATEKQQQGMPSKARPGGVLHPFYPHSVLRTNHRATS